MLGSALAFVADERVGIVLDDEHAPVARQLGDAATPIERERAPARVLERRDRVEERRGQSQGVRIEAVVVHRHDHGLAFVAGDDVQRTVVGGAFDEHARSPLDEQPRQERQTLERAVRDQHLPRVDAVALRRPTRAAVRSRRRARS